MDNTETHLGQFIREEAEKQGSVLRLSEATGISRTTLNRRFSDPDGFTLDELTKVGRVLGFAPGELAAIHEGSHSVKQAA